MTRRQWLCCCLLAAGCRPTQSAPAGTGALEAVVAFYTALVHKDWDAAYAILDASNRSRVTRQRFATLAGTFRGGIGFEPSSVQVSSCEEQGERAVAHVVLIGRPSAHQRFKDAVTLRRGEDGWGVVLAPTFGVTRRR